MRNGRPVQNMSVIPYMSVIPCSLFPVLHSSFAFLFFSVSLCLCGSISFIPTGRPFPRAGGVGRGTSPCAPPPASDPTPRRLRPYRAHPSAPPRTPATSAPRTRRGSTPTRAAGLQRDHAGLGGVVVGQRVGYVVQAQQGVGAASGARLVRPPPEVIADLVACDGPQPAAEAVARTVAAEIGEMFGDGAEHVLENVGGIVGVQTTPPAPVVDQRRV